MKKTRIVSSFLALFLAIIMAFPTCATAKTVPNTGTQIVYRTSKSGKSRIGIELAHGTTFFVVHRADVKVKPGSTGAKLAYFSWDNWTSEEEFRSASGSWSSNASYYCSYFAELVVSNAGTATVDYKINNKTYQTKIRVLGYKNPAKSVILTGVNNDKSMASLTKYTSEPQKSMTLKAKKTNAILTVEAASGWKVKMVNLNDEMNGIERTVGNGRNSYASMKLPCGTLNPKHNYNVQVQFVNSSNKATILCSYSINGSEAN